MREILFRGKRGDNGEWVDGDLWRDYNEEPRCIRDYCGSNPVDPATVGQYTGLTDTNGKRIFEGDILRLWREQTIFSGILMEYRCPLSVEYCELWCAFVVSDNPNKEQFSVWRDFDKFEVIGNIHDNKGLLNDNEV